MATIKMKRGSGLPSGLTAGEPAFDTTAKHYYVHDGSTAQWVGAAIKNNAGATSWLDSVYGDTVLATQYAIDQRIVSRISAGGGGFTLAASNGTAQSVVLGSDTLTIAQGDGIITSIGGTDTITITNIGVRSVSAGTGIAVSGSTGAVTISNTGVQSFNGSTGAVSFVNYVSSAVAGSNITVSGATGAVTIGVTSTPSFTTISTSGNGTVGGNLTVTGNLTVNGTTTTVNSDTMTVDDPVIVLGLSGGLPLTVSDGGKDRGIAFTYYADSAGRTGFFGYDASANEFVFLNRATVTSDVAAGLSFGNVRIGADLDFQPTNLSLTDTIRASGAGYVHTLSSNYGGEIVSSGTYPPNTGYILKSNNSLGSPQAPTWIDPSAAGFTAYASTRLATARNIALTGNVTATGVAFDGTAGITLTTVIPSSTVTNAMLVSSGFTLGSTSISLGSTTTSISGLSSIAATTFTGALSGNASTATALQTARTFSLTGNVTASGITFDGTGNVTLSTTIGSSVVTNAMLVNSGFTLGTTNITLGSTGLTLAGLSSVSATTFTGALSGNASTATTATNVVTTEQTTGTYYLVGAASASSSTGLLIDATATTPLSYNVANGTLTCVQVEALIDGGNY
jgi:hypothetical protein